MFEKQAQVDGDKRACDPQVKMDIVLSSFSKGSSSEGCLITAPRGARVSQNIRQSSFNKELPCWSPSAHCQTGSCRYTHPGRAMKITGKLGLSPFGLHVKMICELQHIYQTENLINPRRGEVIKTISIFRSISFDHEARFLFIKL